MSQSDASGKLERMFGKAERIAWAAGLFEGERSITLSRNRVNMRVKSTDQDVLEQFAAFVGAGKVYGPYDNRCRDGHRRKLFFVWVCYDELEIRRLVRQFAVFLGGRRIRQARELGVLP